MAGLNFEPDGGGAVFHQGFAEGAGDFGGILIGHEAKGQFGAGPGRDDGFTAVTLVTTGEAVDFEGGAGGPAFGGGEAALAKKPGDAEEFLIGVVGPGQAGEMAFFVGRERDDVVVEAGDVNAAIMIDEPGEHFAEGHGGVFHRTAEDAGVQIAGGAVNDEFEGDDAAQGIGEGGVFETRHAGVGNDDGVALEFRAMAFQEGSEVFAADFLLAFDNEGEVAGEFGAGFEPGLDGFQVGEILAFVIACAAAVERAAFDAGLERW